ncbi:uncharacterized protein LOC122508677 [Leptopilina heterotoma]|uniref:uncharacterized protein LOC122508677 n=1 Tax=Leptopilina heterotoma TaxID=63436 RepID=UPI001CA8402D|nr:uncharacterized protein LOC122508677 [Leptopilina heterotoma]
MSKSFYPNECHVCSSRATLKRCSRCQLISYCGEAHQRNDWTNHKTFCDVVYLITRVNNLSHIYENSKGFSIKKWTSERMNMIGHVSSLLDRDLYSNEIGMLNFPRSCIVCHDTRQENLTNCPHCPLVSFCKEHPMTPQHEEECSKIKDCYNFEIDYEDFLEKALFILFTLLHLKKNHQTIVPTSTADYLNQLLEPSMKIDDKTRRYLYALLAPSLSIFSAIQKLNYPLTSKLKISIKSRDNLNDIPQHWETLLHLLPNVQHLTIILDSERSVTTEQDVGLCEKCTAMKRKLITRTLSDLDTDDSFSMNLAVITNMSVPKNWDFEWSIISHMWSLFKCPLIFILSKESQVKQLRRKFRSDSRWKGLICYDGLNEFAPSCPCRSSDDWTIVEDKQFLLVMNAVESNSSRMKKKFANKHKRTNDAATNSSVKNHVLPSVPVKNENQENKKTNEEIPKSSNYKKNVQFATASGSTVEDKIPELDDIKKTDAEIVAKNVDYKEIENQNKLLLKKNMLLQKQIDDVIKENINLKDENDQLKDKILKLEI